MPTPINLQGGSSPLPSSPLKLTTSDEDTGSHNSDSTAQDRPNIQCEWREKLKVQLCKNYLKNKVCPYKLRCKFAHGLQQLLQNRELSTNYRTKKCKIFFERKYCKFGQRCNFKHHDHDIITIKNNHSYMIIIQQYPQLVIGYKNKSRIINGSALS